MIGGLLAPDAHALLWRENLTDATVKTLSTQPQFNGVGIISAPHGSGTGTAIAPGYVLTAKHDVGDGQRVRFNLPGGLFTGTSIADPSSDLALIRLDANTAPRYAAFITANAGNIFTPRAAATSLYWDATNTNASADAGTLAGRGEVRAAVTFNRGATLAPGDSAAGPRGGHVAKVAGSGSPGLSGAGRFRVRETSSRSNRGFRSRLPGRHSTERCPIAPCKISARSPACDR